VSLPRRARTIDLENPFSPTIDGMCELVLVRHGEQVLPHNIAAGEAVDPPLSELGERQVQAVAERLASMHIDAIYSSPLQRALATGEAIGKAHGLTPVPLDALCEINPWATFPPDKGFFDVLGRDEVTAIFRAHGRTRKFTAFPYTEDPVAFRARVVAALGEIVDAHLGQRVVVTCHSGVVNAYLAHVFESDLDMLVRVHHTALTAFRGADTRRSVLYVNDYAHVLPFQTSPGDSNL